MRKFYICTTGVAKGPFSVNEIDKLDIQSNDLIWSKQYYDTRVAIQVPEFREYFKKQQCMDKKYKKTLSKTPVYQSIALALLLSVLLGMLYYYLAV